ncbi:hypothetical protein AB0L59_26430 [Streptomyces sp. NPDC052109]|uniref:hypothetical protein n=1 Tax=Streptomyces sp. NPDC052109 TaxID=3155527 RepID=UPI00341A94E9
MGKVLTTASTVPCGHVPPPPQPPVPGGPPPPPPPPAPPVPGTFEVRSTAKLAVEGHPVLVEASIHQATITNCPNTVSPAKPCTKVLAVAGGQSVKLRAGGAPVMLDQLAFTTDCSPPLPAPPTTTANQSKLTSV